MELKDFFERHSEVAVAFSGGVDSAYLLYAARKYAKKVCAYYVKSEFQPKFELDDAVRLAEELGTELKIIDVEILSVQGVKENPADRCYYCKKAIFSEIVRAAEADGFGILVDGTNASDDEGDRPGFRALRELAVVSPLRECGLSKAEVRRLSKAAGLFTWDKPAYACLATRIPTGAEITAEKLVATEKSEEFLSSLGFRDFRIRMQGKTAKLQLCESQFMLLLENREKILEYLKKYYDSVVLELEGR